MLRNALIFILCLTVSSCFTMRQLPTTANEIQAVDISPDKTYIIQMDNGYVGKAKGDSIAVDQSYIHIKNKEGRVQSSIPIAHVAKFEEEKFNIGKTLLLTGGIILGVIALGVGVGLATWKEKNE